MLAGDPERAVAALERARGRWRGTPYPDLSDDLVVDPFAAGERARLETLRLDADEEWAEACLSIGRHQEIAPLLERAVEDAPLRERRYQQLMVALYGAGRTAEALEVYQRARRTLLDELGIEPGPLLREAEAAVVNHDPARFPGPAAAATSTRIAPARTGPGRFVGRLHEWSRLTATLAAMGTPAGRIVLVGGPPGIGKSRLVHELASAAGPLTVGRGACADRGPTPPLWPLVEALRDLGPSVLPPPGRGLDDDVLVPLRATVEGRLSPTAATARLPLDDHAAFRLHDAVAELVASVAARAPLLLVLDDLHAADAATMGVILRLAHRIDDDRLVVLGTYRDTLGDHTEAFADGHAALRRHSTVGHLTLGPLDHEDVASYLEACDLDPEPLTAAVMARCDGSPLLLTELVALLVERDGDPEALRAMPVSLGAILDARLADLGTARAVIERAAVIGTRFPVDVLARIDDTGTDRVLDALGAAARLGLVDPLGGGVHRFRHTLIAEAAAASLPEGTRAELHLRVAQVLERSRSTDRSVVLTEVARHRLAALPDGDASVAATACLAAAELHHAALADAETIRFAAATRRALDLVEDADPAIAARAMILEAEARTVSGQGARSLLEDAVDAARRVGDPTLLGQAVQALALDRSTAARAGDPVFVAACEEAIAALNGHRGWLPIQLTVDLAMSLYRTPEHARARELCEGALTRARSEDDPVALAFALTGLHQAVLDADTAERREELATEAIMAARSAELAWHESMATAFRGHDRWELGRVDAAAADFDRAASLATVGRRARFVWMARSWQALLAHYRGEVARAERWRLDALAAWGPSPNPDAVLCDLAQRMMIAALAGEVDEFLPIVHHQASHDAEPVFWQCLLALLHAQGLPDVGERAATIGAIDAVMEAGLDHLLPTVTRLPALAFLAEAAARSGHVEAARAVLPALAPLAGRHVVMNVYGGGGLCWGVADQALALAAAVAGEVEDAVVWHRAAVAELTSTGGRPFRRRAVELAAQFLPDSARG